MPLLRFLILFSCPTLFLSAQEVEFNPLGREIPISELDKNLRIQVEWFEIRHETLTDLLEEKSGGDKPIRISSDAGALRSKVRTLAKKDEAKHIDTAILTCRSGQRAKVEGILERIYPTEYDPATAVTKSKDGDSSVTVNKALLPTATAFETRNIGTSVEVDPVMGADEVTIDLNLAPEITYTVGNQSYGTYREGESKVDLVMPDFYTVKITTQISMLDGQHYFVGATSPQNTETGESDRDRKVMIFVKADIIYVGLPAKKE